MTANLSAMQKVQRAHVWLMKHPKYCLYSGIFMLGKTEVDDSVPTACTNGRDKFYGESFINKLSEAEIRALVLHENLHVAFRHLSTWKHLYTKHPTLANMACDYVINLMIYDSDVTGRDVRLPKEGLLDEKYRGWDSQRVFNDLMQQVKDKNSVMVKTMDNQKGEEMPVTDTPSLDEHDWEDGQQMSDAEKEALAKDIDQALRQGKMLAAKMNGTVPREVNEALESKVNWREALREFVNSFCMNKDESTWRRPARRWIGQDVYMPSLMSETLGRVVIAIDTSGSISNDCIGQFLSELKMICQQVRPEGLDLLYWDTHVAQHEKYELEDVDNILQSTRPKGGGGTHPNCIPEYLSAHKIKPECAIILTDGYVYSGWGRGWSCPTLWGITSDKVSKVGRTIRIR